MKTIQKKLLVIFAVFSFAVLMMFNVSITMDDTKSAITDEVNPGLYISGININLGLQSVLAQSSDPGSDPEECEDSCGGSIYCYIEAHCPPGSEFNAVACWGAEYCTTLLGDGVDCDGVVSWCGFGDT